MPEITTEPAPINLTTSLEDVFNRAFSVEEPPEPQAPDKSAAREPVEPAKAIPEKVEEKSKPAKAEEKSKEKPKQERQSISDLLLSEPGETQTSQETKPSEPIKETLPEALKGKSKETREAFEKVAEAKYQAELRVSNLEKELSSEKAERAKGDPDAKTRIGQLENQLKQYETLVERANLEMHPQFQARFTVPRKQLLESALTAFRDAGGEPEQLESALSLKGKARADKLDELLSLVTSKTLLGKIERASEQIENLDGARENVLKNQAQVLKNLQEQDQVARHKQLEEFEKQTLQHLADARRVLADEYKLEVFKKVDDPKFEWWNEEIDKMDRAAEHIMLKIDDPREMAIAARLAVAAPRYRVLYLEEHKARVKAEKQLQEYKSSEPGLGGGQRKGGSTEEDDSKRSLASYIIESVKKGS